MNNETVEASILEEKKTLPIGTVFTIKVPLDRDQTKFAEYHLKEMDESIFMAAKSMIDGGKHFDAVRMLIKVLHVGGDSPEILKTNFVALNSCVALVLEIISPVGGELKKN